MIIDAWNPNTASLAIEPEPFGWRQEALADAVADDADAAAAEIRRMIELSGRIGLDCGLLEDE